MSEDLKNHELVTLAVYLVGGDLHEADTEDVAVKVNELAPGRYTWRKYRDQINIEIIRAFLSDAKKSKYGALLNGTGSVGWLLTEAGLEFAKSHVDRVTSPAEQVERLSKNKTRLSIWLRSVYETRGSPLIPGRLPGSGFL